MWGQPQPAPSASSWLSAATAASEVAGDGLLTLQVNPQSMPPGLHKASLSVSALRALQVEPPGRLRVQDLPAVTLLVHVHVLAPKLSIQPGFLELSLPPESSRRLPLRLENVGTAPLTWAAQPDNTSWLVLGGAPLSGALAPGSATLLSVTTNASAVPTLGRYSTSLSFTSNDAAGVQSLSVTMLVTILQILPSTAHLPVESCRTTTKDVQVVSLLDTAIGIASEPRDHCGASGLCVETIHLAGPHRLAPPTVQRLLPGKGGKAFFKLHGRSLCPDSPAFTDADIQTTSVRLLGSAWQAGPLETLDERTLPVQLQRKPGHVSAERSYFTAVVGHSTLAPCFSSSATADSLVLVSNAPSHCSSIRIELRDASGGSPKHGTIPKVECSETHCVVSSSVLSHTPNATAFTLRPMAVGVSMLRVSVGGRRVHSASGTSMLRVQVLPAACGAGQITTVDGMDCECAQGHARPPASVRGQSLVCQSCDAGTVRFGPEAAMPQCTECPVGTFANAAQDACEECPSQGAVCIAGKLVLRAGFWCETCVPASFFRTAAPSLNAAAQARYDAFLPSRSEVFARRRTQSGKGNSTEFFVTEASRMLPCFPSAACEVNAASGATQCARGHQGIICGECATGWARSSARTLCMQCATDGRDLALLLVMLGFLCLLLTAMICSRSGTRVSTPPTAIFRILSSWFQVAALLIAAGLIPSTGLDSTVSILSTATAGISFSSSNAQCALGLSWYQQLHAAAALPLVCVAAPLLCAAACNLVRGRLAVHRHRSAAVHPSGAPVLSCCGWRRASHILPAGPQLDDVYPSGRSSLSGSARTSSGLESTPSRSWDSPIAALVMKTRSSPKRLFKPLAPLDGGRHSGRGALPPRHLPKQQLPRDIVRARRASDAMKRGKGFIPSLPRIASLALSTGTVDNEEHLRSQRERGTDTPVKPPSPMSYGIRAALILVFVVHFSVVQVYLNMLELLPEPVYGFNVFRHSPGHGSFDRQYSHASTVATLALLVVGLGAPLGAAVYLGANRTRLHAPSMQHRAGFLFAGFRLHRRMCCGGFWFWELLVTLRKVLVMTVVVTVDSEGTKGMLLALLLGVSLIAHTAAQPYKARLLNALEGCAVACLWLGVLLGIVSNEARGRDPAAVLVIAAVTGLLNVAFLLLCLCVLLSVSWSALRRSLRLAWKAHTSSLSLREAAELPKPSGSLGLLTLVWAQASWRQRLLLLVSAVGGASREDIHRAFSM